MRDEGANDGCIASTIRDKECNTPPQSCVTDTLPVSAECLIWWMENTFCATDYLLCGRSTALIDADLYALAKYDSKASCSYALSDSKSACELRVAASAIVEARFTAEATGEALFSLGHLADIEFRGRNWHRRGKAVDSIIDGMWNCAP